MKKHCKVITTCFIGREVREKTMIEGTPPGFFHHAQNFPSPKEVLELVAYLCELERSVDPGVETDTVLVNNDVGWQPGNQFLQGIADSRTFAGRLRVIHRENYGRSFGGYNRAYEVFREEYEYWTFTEDDILVIGPNYGRLCIDRFNAGPNTGFVAIQGLSTDHALHAHGGVGTTRVNVLGAVYQTFGALPHCGRDQPQTFDNMVETGEIPFTNRISQLGYDLVEVKATSPLYAYAYDHMRGIRSNTWRQKSRLGIHRLQYAARSAIRALVRPLRQAGADSTPPRRTGSRP